MVSRTYKFLSYMGLRYSSETYGKIGLYQVFKRVCKSFKDAFLLKCIMNFFLLEPLLHKKIRPVVLRLVGCKVGKHVFIGSNVMIDAGHARLITIEDRVYITARCMLLCHQRDLSNYYVGDDFDMKRFKTGHIHLKKGCALGMNTLIMPGVTVGEGAVVGAYSLVTKDIPAWTIAVGRPAKVIKEITPRKTPAYENTDV